VVVIGAAPYCANLWIPYREIIVHTRNYTAPQVARYPATECGASGVVLYSARVCGCDVQDDVSGVQDAILKAELSGNGEVCSKVHHVFTVDF
jgi:hypothetical protein